MLNNKIIKGNKNLRVLHTDAEQVDDGAYVMSPIRPLETRLALPEQDGVEDVLAHVRALGCHRSRDAFHILLSFI